METPSLIFTEYIRSIEPGIEPPLEAFEAVWEKLRDALRSEMMQRSVWSAPPSYLGICGFDNWGAEEALEELMCDCYAFIFVRRLPGLTSLLEGRANVEGVVFLNIRHFLFEKQKRHDPIGYRTFKVLQSAARRAIAAEMLYVLDGDAKVSNPTILGFRLGVDPESSPFVDLSRPADEWSDGLLPQLMTARGAQLDEVVAKLREGLSELSILGVECFRFKNVIDPFKGGVRQRWSTIWRSSQGELAFEDGDEEFVQVVRKVRPDSGFEERESFSHLVTCVGAALDRLEARPNTLDYLDRLWTFLRSHASEDDGSTTEEHGSRLPSRRKIAEILDIPRYRLAELHDTLAGLVETCRSSEAGPRRGEAE